MGLLYAAQVGTCDAVRLLLYAGADISVTVLWVLPFRVSALGAQDLLCAVEGADVARDLTLQVRAPQVALLRADMAMLELLVQFGEDPATVCNGSVPCQGCSECVEEWVGLNLVHLAILNRMPNLVASLLRLECDVNAMASSSKDGGATGTFSPLAFAVLSRDVHATAQLVDIGCVVDDSARASALKDEILCEMFGGTPTVTLDDWVAALLSGEHSLQQLLDRRTDLSRALDWPSSDVLADMLTKHRLAGPELVDRLVKAFAGASTMLRAVRPVHLACVLQQPWALEMLADAGISVSEAPECFEVPANGEAIPPGGLELSALPLDALLLCVRFGGLQTLEVLARAPRFALDVRKELPMVPDVTPAYYPRSHPGIEGDLAVDSVVTWAWCRLAPLELALLHRRVDVAVLLARLGADLLHTVDHVALRAPTHYSITDACFRGLTPLHLCALLDLRTAASALLGQACGDEKAVVPGEHSRPQRQSLLSAVCVQCWATVETEGEPEKEPWLWRDVTPLHLSIIAKHYDVAELFIDMATPETLGQLCFSRDVAGDTEQSFSALLMAYERNLKDLHRRIARRFPVC